MPESWTTLKLIRWTTEYFEKKGIPNPRLDAELLLAHALKCQRIDLYIQHEKMISEKDLAKFRSLVERRAKREPLQYILGETDFWGLKIKVTPDVLIPRPETELLVEEAIKAVSSDKCLVSSDKGNLPSFTKHYTLNTTPCILDIGTGSGCIAIALAKNIPNAQVIATDISKEALALAKENIATHGLAGQIKTILADIAPWRVFETEGRKFDLIISNPPYIPSGQIPSLQAEVRDYEPRMALDGGTDGLKYIRQILMEAPKLLKRSAHLLFEIGEEHGSILASQEAPELKILTIRKDYSGLERIVVCRKV